MSREKLREQHALGEEIASAITSAPIGEPIDEGELDDELAELEQEQLDDKMLQTGNVPVSDEIHRLPAAANGESMLSKPHLLYSRWLTWYQSKVKHLCVQRKRMKRKNFGNCKLRWPCDHGALPITTFLDLPKHTSSAWDLHAIKGFRLLGIPHFALKIPGSNSEPAF
jgi:hypothetical protein